MPATPDDHSQRPFLLTTTLALYALGFALAVWPWLSGVVTIPGGAKSLFFPQLSFLAQSLGEGQSPFWSPHIQSGWPQIADPRALIFSPLHFSLALAYPVPGFQAADAITFAHLFLGGLAIILIFHDRGWHPAGALVGALGFAFGAANAGGLSQTLSIECVCWLMLALWLVLRSFASPKRKALWLCAAAAGLLTGLLAIGRTPTALMGLYLLAALVLWQWLMEPDRLGRLKAGLGPLALAIVLAVAVAFVPLMLTLMQTGALFGDLAAGTRGLLHPAHFLTMVFADLFSASERAFSPWGPSTSAWIETFGGDPARGEPIIQKLYAGALVSVVVLGFGLVRGWLWARDIRFFTLALAVALIYAFEGATDALFIFGALLAFVAGYLVHRWLDEGAPQSNGQGRAQVAIILCLIALSFALAGLVGRVSEAVMPVLTGIVFAGGALIVLLLARRTKSRLIAATIVAAFVTADLAWNNRPDVHSGQPPQMFEMLRADSRNETVALLKWRLAPHETQIDRDRVSVAELGNLWRNIGQVHRFDQPLGDGVLRRHPTFIDVSGVRFLATQASDESEGLEQIAKTRDGMVYENADPLPRALLYGQWIEADFASVRRNALWPDVDPARTVLLERAPQGIGPAQNPGQATISHYGNTQVEFAVQTADGGVLVLHDTWHPWWRATLNGKPVAIERANLFFRAVIVPPGQHVLRFQFHPFSGAFAQFRAWVHSALR